MMKDALLIKIITYHGAIILANEDVKDLLYISGKKMTQRTINTTARRAIDLVKLFTDEIFAKAQVKIYITNKTKV